MNSQPESYDKIKILAAFALVHLTEQGSGAVTVDELVSDLAYSTSEPDLPDIFVSIEEMVAGLELLARYALIEKYEYRHTTTRYEAKAEARKQISGNEAFYQEYRLYLRLEDSWLREALENINETEIGISHSDEDTNTKSVPASDRVVTLDHNSNEYQEAASHLDELIEAVEEDRGNDFEDKDQRLAELKAGRELLISSTANPTRVQAVLYGCLAYLATKFADEPIGALAVATWTAIKTLFGL